MGFYSLFFGKRGTISDSFWDVPINNFITVKFLGDSMTRLVHKIQQASVPATILKGFFR
jgi:hypothetical protein